MLHHRVSLGFYLGWSGRRRVLIFSFFLLLALGLWWYQKVFSSQGGAKPSVENRLILKRLCARNLLRIYQALQEYRLEYGGYPGSLRGLTPRFLAPQQILCPADLGATGKHLSNGSYFYPGGPRNRALILPYNRRIQEAFRHQPGSQRDQVLVYCPWHWEARPGYSIDHLLVVTTSGKVWEISSY